MTDVPEEPEEEAFAATMVPDAPPPPLEELSGRKAMDPIDAASLHLEFGDPLPEPRVSEALEKLLSRETEESFGAHWKPGRRIGAGGMGEVHIAQDVRVGREVAIKRLLPGAHTQDAMERFIREARVQGRLDHPSVVPVHDLGLDPNGQPYFVMKRIHGMTLGEILRGLSQEEPDVRARFTRRKLLLAFQRALLTLDFAHQRGVLHRDLKPSNLMLGDFGEVYVLDWGLAKVEGADDSIQRQSELRMSDAGTKEGSMIGTPGYAPPEQLRGQLDAIGPASDVYGMGVVLYELLALQRMSGDAGPAERMMRTMSGVDARPSRVRPDVPKELDAICERATARDPADRYPTMRAFHDALDEFLGTARDLEIVGEMADRHEARAADFAADANDPERALGARADALREVGKALALRPNSPEALKVLMELLDTRPPEVPAEVELELNKQNAERTRRALKLGAGAYVMWLFIVPLLLWMGLRDVVPMWIGFVAIMGAIAAAFIGGRQEKPSAVVQFAMLILSTAAIACSARAFGALVLVPQIVTANTFAYVLTESSRRRMFFVAISILGMVVPFALEGAEVWAPSYMFENGSLVVLPNLVELPPVPTLTCLWLVSLLIIVVSTYWAGKLRDELRDVERDVALQRWHLAQLYADPDTIVGRPSQPK